MIADMRSGKISVLVVWQSSRIERRGAYNAFDLARRVREAGGRIEYVKDSHLNMANDMADVALAMNATMDRLPSKAKSDAIIKKHAALRERKSLIGRPPLGFLIVCEQCGRKPERESCRDHRKLLVPDPVLAPVIREAVRRYLDGASVMEVCVWLDGQGIKPVTADTWGHTSLVKVFRNPSLAGRRKSGSGRPCSGTRRSLTRTRSRRSRPELDRKGRRRGIGTAEPSLLNEIATCAKCGGPMARFVSSCTRRNGAKYVRRY